MASAAREHHPARRRPARLYMGRNHGFSQLPNRAGHSPVLPIRARLMPGFATGRQGLEPGMSTQPPAFVAADIPADAIETTDWKTRNAGPVLRHRFRFGSTGNYMELQIPVLPNGKPAY